ncbi:MAG: zinc ribbon domain-containing protein [Clostridia bacterium]|nr:zinc ribbon domain-containing protein [Clostridia bacterium]
MSLINCVECGAKVSDLAKSCPKCGAPVGEELKNISRVQIKIPVVRSVFLGTAVDIQIYANGNLIWSGRSGNIAEFEIKQPTEIIIQTKKKINMREFSTVVVPGKKYRMVQDEGLHMYETYRLTVVDFIDSE